MVSRNSEDIVRPKRPIQSLIGCYRQPLVCLFRFSFGFVSFMMALPPHINSGSVDSFTKQQLGRSVP